MIDSTIESNDHQYVLKLLPTLDGLIFAVDAKDHLDHALVKSELQIMLRGLEADLGAGGQSGSPIPLLILCCTNSEPCDIDLKLLATNLDMDNLKAKRRPWAMFKVDIGTMAGVEQALTWVLYHNQKQKTDWQYHVHHVI
jgi:hypothetical protein